jgi:hypothetical protein
MNTGPNFVKMNRQQKKDYSIKLDVYVNNLGNILHNYGKYKNFYARQLITIFQFSLFIL